MRETMTETNRIPCPCGCGETFEPVKRGANVRGYATDECRRRFDRVIRAFGRAHFESGMSILDMEAVADALNARNSSRATDTGESRHIEAAE